MDHRYLGRGALLAGATALISGVSVYVAKYGTQAVPDPFVYTTARNACVGLALLIGLVLAGHAENVRSVNRTGWCQLGLIALIGGSIPFLLFFWGLSMTNAGVAALIHKTLFLWVALFAMPILGERVGRWQIIALGVLAIGLFLLGPVAVTSIDLGAALVFLATLLWAAETILVRRTLRDVPPTIAATARMAGGALVMLAFLAATGRMATLLSLSPTQVLWVVVPSVFLFGYVVTWYHALKHAPAIVVTSVLTLGAPITAVLAAAAPVGKSVSAGSLVLAPVALSSSTMLGIAMLLIGTVIFLASSRSARRMNRQEA